MTDDQIKQRAAEIVEPYGSAYEYGTWWMVKENVLAAVERALREDIAMNEKDAARYRWLRAQHWTDKTLCVTAPSNVLLGSDAPSFDRLDDAIDVAMKLPAPNTEPLNTDATWPYDIAQDVLDPKDLCRP